MLRLRLDTTYLDTTGISIQLSIHCPLFDAEGAESIYSFPFKLPLTPTNVAALEHAHRIDNASNITTFTNAVLEIGGMMQVYGVLDLDDQPFTGKEITAVFRNTVSDFLDELDDIDIDEILETITASVSPPTPQWIFDVDAPPSTYSIAIDGLFVIVGLTESATLTLSEVIDLLVERINDDWPGMASNGGGTQLLLDADMLAENTVTFYNGAFTLNTVTSPGQSELQGLLNHIDSVNNTPVSTHCWPTLYWLKFYKGANYDKFTNWINPWWDGDTITINPYAEQPNWETTYIPMVKVPYILSRIVANADSVSSFEGHVADNADMQALIVLNDYALDTLEQDYYEVNTLKYLNKMKTSIDLNEHVPSGMSAKEFWLAIIDGFALWYRVIGTMVVTYVKRDMLTSPPIDWTDLSEPDYTATRIKREGYRLQLADMEDTEPDKQTPLQLQPYTYGDEGEKYELPFNSAAMVTRTSPVSGNATLTPSFRRAGSSDEAGLGDNPLSALRFLFYRDLQEDGGAEEYPFATHGATAQDASVIGGLSFDLNDANYGLYEQRHKGIPELLADGQPVTLALRLGLQDIITAMQWENARRTVTLPHGQMTGVIQKITFKASNDGISIALVDFIMEK